ncbi:MAG: hypothetical protein M1828_005140 [Chrysothrix sp. TS-e1954]|nr:MAG: hypothetical protein M1828_005140 [Chrysothrix sp. TS-e1954]
MPPIRQLPASKPLKTERTHEENQERAYIAASRRSDRSLEARVESARRASEIHKRRTGRSLRVTEQDVVNEEMYEEEDDDLPLQYRRLTAHLNTNSSDFNRRLAAYLTNHVAMRNALGQAVNSSYAQGPMDQFSQAPQTPLQAFARQNMQGSPFAGNGMQPQMMQSPTPYRQSPYPMPGDHSFRPHSQQNRPSSLAIPQHQNGGEIKTENNMGMGPPLQQQQQQQQQQNGQRRMSAPPKPELSQDGSPQRHDSSSSLSALGGSLDHSHSHTHSHSPPHSAPIMPNGSFNFNAPTNMPTQPFDNPPFSTFIPPESQMFFPSNFDMANIGIPQTLGGNGSSGEKTTSQPFYSYKPNAMTANPSKRNVHPSYDGMSQTLAPGALDSKIDNSWPDMSTGLKGGNVGMTSAFGYPFDYSYGGGGDDFLKGVYGGEMGSETAGFGGGSGSGFGSGQCTPGDQEWHEFIETGVWDDQTT